MESHETELKFLYLLFDLIILNLAILALLIIDPVFGNLSVDNRSLYFLHANMSEIIAYLLFSKRSLYIHNDFSKRLKGIVKRVEAFVIVLFVTAQIFLPAGYSLLFMLEYTLLFFTGKLLYYYLLYRFLKYRRANGHFIHRALIIGLNDMGVLLRDLMNNNPMLGYKFVGYVADNKEQETEVLGELDDLARLVADHEIDYLFVTDSAFNSLNRCKELLASSNQMGVRLRFVPENQHWFRSNNHMESVGFLQVINPQEIPLDSLKARFLKRSFDVIFALLVIIFIISWLFPILFILIKLDSKGPVFFIQERTGINNKTFRCLKFRSMCLNKDANTKQATAGDSRVTLIGRFLRKSNLDEFPQFFNVLLGQMSVVGPRPHMLKHTEQYSELIDYYRVRHYVKPGITGWAQVNGYRGLTDELWKMQKRVEYDMYYLNHWSLWWDVKIVFMTIFGSKSRENAF